MAIKTDEEIYEYVLNYKNNLLHQNNDSIEHLQDKANENDSKLGSDLIVLASAALTIIGGLIALNNLYVSLTVKNLVICAVLCFFASIVGGLKYYDDSSKFWVKWADHKSQHSKEISEDSSKTVEELEKLLKKQQEESAAMPNRSKTGARKLQVYTFGIGTILLCCVIIALLFAKH